MAEVGPQRLQNVEAELLEVADRREGGVLSMRRVTATREVVNSVRRKCSDKIIDMFLYIFDIVFDVLLFIPVDDWGSPRWGRVM